MLQSDSESHASIAQEPGWEPILSQLVATEVGMRGSQGPWSSSHPNPHLHPFLPLGWTVSPRLQATARRDAGRHFLKSPWGGEGEIGGGARGRGQVWAGDGDGVGTRWKIGPRQLNSSQSPGSRPRCSSCARAAQERGGSPGCCSPGHALQHLPDARAASPAAVRGTPGLERPHPNL